jgi:signal transduction histidine kinase
MKVGRDRHAGWSVGLNRTESPRTIWLVATLLLIATGALAAWLALPVLSLERIDAGPAAPTWIRAASSDYTRRAAETDRVREPRHWDRAIRSGPRQYSLEFELSETPADQTAVYSPGVSGPIDVFVNRVPREAEDGTFPSASPILLMRPLLVPVPAESFHPAANRIDLIIQPDASGAWPRQIWLAAEADAREAVRRQQVLNGLLPRLTGIVGAAALILGMGLVLARRTRRDLVILLAISLVWGASVLPLAAEGGLPGWALGWLGPTFGAVLTLTLVTGATILVRPTAGRRALAGGAGLGGIMLLAGLPIWPTALDTAAGLVFMGLGLVIGLAGAVLVVVRCARTSARSITEAALCIALIIATAYTALALVVRWAVLPPAGFALEIACALLAIGLLVAGLCAHALSLSQVVLAAYERRRSLMAVVREQEALISSKDRIIEREATHRATLEERERLTRDIHDGIGGQLLSLLVRMRSGKISRGEIEAQVEDGLNDLRLIIASLDHHRAALPETLAVAHARLKQQVEGAGMTLDWVESGSLSERLSPDQVLNVLRVLQESVTNAVRHSGADRVRVEILGETPESQLELIIADDGVGFDPDARQSGLGLLNIRRRAASLGAALSLRSGPPEPGVEIRLSLPGRSPTIPQG